MRSLLPVAAALVLLGGTANGAAQSSPRTPEIGIFRLHKFKQAIGQERYEIIFPAGRRVLTDTFSFTDRGSRVPLTAALTATTDLDPLQFEVKGKNSRFSTIDVGVDVHGQSAAVRVDSVTQTRNLDSSPFFTISGYAPVAMQQELVRYWDARRQPKTITTLPSGQVHLALRGIDTVMGDAHRVVLRRISIEGLIWGRETLWMDDANQLIALVSIDAEFDHFEAVRDGYESALSTFIACAAADGAKALAELASVQPDTGSFALVGGTLIDGTGAPAVANAVVVVQHGRITAAGPRANVQIPPGVRSINIAGKSVLPGLWDMHAHYEQVEWGPIYLAAGVTTVRDVGNEFDFITAVRDAIRSGRGIGPEMFLAGVVDGPGPYGLGVERAATAEEGVKVVQRYHDAGFQQIKIYSSIQLPVLQAITTEAHRLGMTVTGHIPNGLTAYQGVEAGMDQINHIQYIVPIMKASGGVPLNLDSPEAQKAIAFLHDHHTVLDPTLAIFEWSMHPARIPFSEFEPGVTKVAPELREQLLNTGSPPATEAQNQIGFNEMLQAVGALHRAGVTIVAGTDQTVPGYSLHREIELYVKAGFTPMEAIQAATLVPAQVMHADNEVGTVSVGKRADLIVVDGNPLMQIESLRKVTLVVTNGRRYDPAPLWRSVGFTP